MRQTIWRLLPFDVTQYARMESWLEDMAAQGWLLTDGVLPLLVQFQRGDAPQRRYRIIPVTDRLESGAEADEIALYETYGWKHVYQRRGMEIFYTDYPHAEELFTDAASFRLRARRHLLGHALAVLALTLLLLNVIRSLFGLTEILGTEPLHLLHFMGGTFAVGLACCTVMALVSSCVGLVRYGRLLNAIEGKTPMPRGAPYRRALRWNRALTLLSFLSIAAVFVGMGVSHNFPETRLSSADNGTFGLTHPVPLKDWDPAAWEQIETCVETGRWTEPNFYIEDRYRDILFSDIQMVDAGVAGARYMATWYEARSPGIARRFLGEELPRSAEAFSLQGTDYAAFTEDTDQVLYLLRGNRILIVRVAGDRDLRAEAALFAADLAK